jgi:ankyrin repeat protein
MIEDDKKPAKERSFLKHIGQSAVFTAATIGIASEPGCAPPKPGASAGATTPDYDPSLPFPVDAARKALKDNLPDLALKYSIGNGNLDDARAAIEAGARVNPTDLDSTSLLFLCTWEHTSPLFEAVKSGKVDMVKLLRSEGADVNLMVPGNDLTVFHEAAYGGDPEMFRALLTQSNAKLNVRDGLGQTALHITAKWGYFDASQELVNRGIDVTLEDTGGHTAGWLARACGDGHPDLANMIDAAGKRHTARLREAGDGKTHSR